MIKKNSAEPMYRQIVDILKQEILDHKYENDSNLGTQKEMTERFGVSLITIRKVLEILQAQDLVVIKQGKGTFVKNKESARDLQVGTGFATLLVNAHKHGETKEVKISHVKLDASEDSLLKRDFGSNVLKIEIEHKNGNAVHSYGHVIVPNRFQSVFTEENIKNYKIHHIFQNILGLPLGKVNQKIYVSCATKEMANKMHIAVNAPVMCIERHTFAKDGTLVEYMKLICEQAQFSANIELDLPTRI